MLEGTKSVQAQDQRQPALHDVESDPFPYEIKLEIALQLIKKKKISYPFVS